MPRTSTKQKLEQDQNTDNHLPPPDDDIEPAPSAAANDDEGSSAVPSRQQRQAKPEPEDRLGEITKLYRQIRDQGKIDAEADNDDADGDDGDLDDGESLRANQSDDQSTQQNLQPQNNVNRNNNQQTQDPVVDLKIDGVEIQLPLSKVKELAQKNIAGDNRLEYAQRILKDAKAFRDQVSGLANQQAEPGQGADQSQTPSQTDPASAQAKTNQSDLGIDDEKIDAIVDRIQVGDKEAGKEAIKELVSLIRAERPALNEQAVFDLARRAFIQQEIDREIKTAAERFVTEHKPIVSDRYRFAAAMARLTDEMVSELQRAGVPEQDLAPYRNDPKTLGQWLAYARIEGRKVRTYSQMLDDVAKFIGQHFNGESSNPQQNNTPAGSQQTQQQQVTDASQQRLERKAALQSQPRSATLRVTMPSANQKPRTAVDIVMEMRRQRGFAD